MLTRPQNIPDKMDIFIGKPIVLKTEVSRPSAKVKWLLNGREIEESSNVNITEDGCIRCLTIHSSTPVDSGKYTCEAVGDKIDFQVKVSGRRQNGDRNRKGYLAVMSYRALLVSASSEPPVRILRKSEIKTQVRSSIADDIVLECELSRANAVTKWYKDGFRVEGNERFCEEEEGTYRSLVILNAEPGDSGEYFLDAGDDSISFQVSVEGKIRLPDKESVQRCLNK